MQLIKELTQQFSPTEWFRAFFNHVPTACKKPVKGGFKLGHAGGTLAERTEALQKLQNEVRCNLIN